MTALLLIASTSLGFAYELPEYEVIVVQVDAVDDRGATNFDPPKVELIVVEVLRGEKRGLKLPAKWIWMMSGDDRNCGLSTIECHDLWQARQLKGPPVGSWWIVAGLDGADGRFRVLVETSHPHTEELQAQIVLEMAARPNRTLFFLVLGLPGFSLVFVSLGLMFRRRAQRPFMMLAIGTSVLGFAVFAWWEGSTAHAHQVRTDLLLLIASVGLQALLLFTASFLLWRNWGWVGRHSRSRRRMSSS